jgi:hypothetical protein
VFSRDFAEEQIRVFEDDKSKCQEMTYKKWRGRSPWKRFMEVSPLRSALSCFVHRCGVEKDSPARNRTPDRAAVTNPIVKLAAKKISRLRAQSGHSPAVGRLKRNPHRMRSSCRSL